MWYGVRGTSPSEGWTVHADVPNGMAQAVPDAELGWITPDLATLAITNTTDQLPTDAALYAPPYPLWASVLIALLIGIIIILILFGNVLVILSVCLDRRLRKPPNILIINLAVSDMAVAVLDMPFAAAFELKGEWAWGPAVCDMWISCDVVVCTASIMTLCMISVDRYMAITRPLTYVNKRTPRLMLIFILIVWVTSAFIGLQPLFIWGGNEHENKTCLVSQDPYFTVVSTFGAFYLPLTVMLLVYAQIYRAARKSEMADLKQRHRSVMLKLEVVKPEPCTTTSNRSQSVDSTAAHSSSSCDDNNTTSSPRSQERRPSVTRVAEFLLGRTRFSSGSIKQGPRRISLKRERKAAKTLGVIMGAFIFCWLPFFIVALVRPYCNCEIPPLLNSFLLFLGFTNSLLNPIIYPFFNKDFVPTYRRMLSCRCLRKDPGGNFYRRRVTFRQVSLPMNGHHDDEELSSDEDDDDESAGRHPGMVHFAPHTETGKMVTELNGNLDRELGEGRPHHL
ncbi:5-hydroxytryptamine receptor 1A-alpha-like [Patiria miniata]|uniref:G-protein coupled receptors family 1 profile domain-containing protein n=1 Tax=Patiria miniata TaxID=46514 RepID=A0A913Z2Z8_PATMI|nr:5-hydroxytryptamine receptor 1A-alpha-like [Patiria miniata]